MHEEATTPRVTIPALFHVAAAAWIAGMLGLAATAPAAYRAALQEDRFIEWWTVGLFAAAAIVRFRHALPRRRWFDLLVALFCVFVAGEEFSWGQRLLGFAPPAAFLEHNTQQELTLHNFADVFGQPKGVLILALLGYGAVLPLAASVPAGRRVLAVLRATSPPAAAVPWLLAGAVLLWWYPAEYTGEWVEALAGATFFAAAAPSRRTLWLGTAAGAAAAVALALVSARPRGGTADQLACAGAEVEALIADIVDGAAAPRLLERSGSVHKRLQSAVREGYLDGSRLLRFRDVACGDRSLDRLIERRRHGIDPWSMAYWIRADRPRDGTKRVVVYSMGPNRRRDRGSEAGLGGDDVRAEVQVDIGRAQQDGRAGEAGAPRDPHAAGASGGADDVDPAIVALMDRWRGRVPPGVLLRRGACPFECCLYRRWTAVQPIPVVARERAEGAVLFTIPAGDSFRADSGNVHITGVGLVAVEAAVGGAGAPAFGPGDTLVVLDYVGEGRFNVWDDGRVLEVDGFWGAEQADPRASLLGRWASEWWVHVTTDEGREGWTHVVPGQRLVSGADACAG